MTAAELDPLIHAPARLRIVATLAALPEGESLSFTRLQELIGLTPGNLITHLRKLDDAGYLETEKTGNGQAARTTFALTLRGRAALESYTAALRDLLGGDVLKEVSREPEGRAQGHAPPEGESRRGRSNTWNVNARQ